MRLALLLLLFALPLADVLAAADGAGLFREHCSACHGYEGQGGMGLPLSLPDFLAVADDAYLSRTIQYGRPGRLMPAFRDRLNDSQVSAIVAYLRGLQPGVSAPPIDDRPVKGDARHGEALYQKHCQRCHGSDGWGGRGTGVTFSRPRDFPVMPPALNNPGFQAAASDRFIHRTILNGRRGTPMPSFRDKGLSDQDIDDIVRYVRRLGRAPGSWQAPAEEPPVLSVDSPYSLQQTVDNVKRAVVGNNFRTIRVQPLEEGLRPAGKESPSQYVIFFCNFAFANKALGLDPRVGLFLPCQITVQETAQGEVKVMSMNPKFMSRIYNNRELDDACSEMHDLYLSIMEEATL